MSHYDIDRCINFVFCIDGTSSMIPFIEMVKENTRSIISKYMELMDLHLYKVNRLRVKIIVFRDYKTEGSEAIQISQFFELNEQAADFSAFLSSITATGGGDSPENGLEALYFAMKSDFTMDPYDRQVIILFSDAPALLLKERESYEGYPSNMVNFEQLVEFWMGESNDTSSKLINRLKRITIVAPEDSLYEQLISRCDYSLFIPFKQESTNFCMPIDQLVKIMLMSCS